MWETVSTDSIKKGDEICLINCNLKTTVREVERKNKKIFRVFLSNGNIICANIIKRVKRLIPKPPHNWGTNER